MTFSADIDRIDAQIRQLAAQFSQVKQMWRSVMANRQSSNYYRHKLRLVRADRRELLAECKRLQRLVEAPERRRIKAREELRMRASA